MKVYKIRDEIRKLKGENEYTHYEFSFERDKQVKKRLERYRKQGYDVDVVQEWWTTKEIVLKSNGGLK